MCTPRHLHLEIRSPEDPVTGTLKDEQGREISFSGWMSLAVALEQILDPNLREEKTA
jgi:hypothetical protein